MIDKKTASLMRTVSLLEPSLVVQGMSYRSIQRMKYLRDLFPDT